MAGAVDPGSADPPPAPGPGGASTTGVLLCLGTRKGYEVLREAVRVDHGRPLHVCTFKEKGVVESFDGSIRALAAASGVPVVPWKGFREAPWEFLDGRGIGAILCIGWRFLVPEAVLDRLDGGVVIAHDSLLPKLRGFAPLATALIAGESRTGVTFLRAAAGVDDGPVLWQGEVPIEADDTIGALIEKVGPLYAEGARRFLLGELREAQAQDERQATYSLWRDEIDYRIDWSEPADRIERLVRAVGPPYLGAQTQVGGRSLVVERAEVVPDLTFAIRQPGKIWCLDPGGRPSVVCGTGLLKIVAATSGGENALPLTSLRQRFT